MITNLLANMVVVGMTGLIHTNYTSTPAFQEYGFKAMFNQATGMVASWHLDLPQPVATNMVTYHYCRATVEGLNGTLIFSNRFLFGWASGGFSDFQDKPNNIMRAESDNVATNDAILEEWMRATNQLTMEKALQIAESAMKTVGVPMDKRDFTRSTTKRQRKYRWKDGKIYPLPYYEFLWDTNENYCNVDVSGITSNLVHFDSTRSYLKPIKPTHEMLDLPTNTVFVYRAFHVPGQPPAYELYTNFNSR